MHDTSETITEGTMVGIYACSSCFLAGVIAAGFLSSPWPLIASVLGVILLCLARGVRCPQCGRRLTERRVPVDEGPAYRRFWECSHCVAVWDGEAIIDPTQD